MATGEDGRVSVWQLFRPGLWPATLMLAGGVTLYAVETYITATIAPSIVRDIGGLPLLSWVTTLFVTAAVLGAIFIAMRPRFLSLRAAYVVGALVFAAGSLLCAMAPTMETVIAGRVVQGFGAGNLSALAYAFVRFAYPERLWPTASTLYAAIWGIATLLGPSLGGFFADGSNWRHAFIILVPLGLLMAALAPRLLPETTDDRAGGGTPFLQIGLLLAAVLLISLAGTAETNGARMALIGLSVAAFAAMILAERRLVRRLLPLGAVHIGHPAAKVYLVMFVMLVILSSDIYVPYFLQGLHGVSPLISGYMTAFVAVGWTLAAFFSAALKGRAAGRAILIGCVVEALATLALCLLISRDNPQASLVLLVPAGFALLMMGFGVGLGWAHLVTALLRIVTDDEQDKASSAISTVQSLGSAFGAALSGVIVNSTGLLAPGGTEGAMSAAFWLYLLMALPGIITTLAASRLVDKI